MSKRKERDGWFWDLEGRIFQASWWLHHGQNNNTYYEHHDDMGPYKTFRGARRAALSYFRFEYRLREEIYLKVKNNVGPRAK